MYITKDKENLEKAKINFNKIIKEMDFKGLEYKVEDHKSLEQTYLVTLKYKKYKYLKNVPYHLINIPPAFIQLVNNFLERSIKYENFFNRAKKEIKKHNKRYSENLKVNINHKRLLLIISDDNGYYEEITPYDFKNINKPILTRYIISNSVYNIKHFNSNSYLYNEFKKCDNFYKLEAVIDGLKDIDDEKLDPCKVIIPFHKNDGELYKNLILLINLSYARMLTGMKKFNLEYFMDDKFNHGDEYECIENIYRIFNEIDFSKIDNEYKLFMINQWV